MRRVAGCGSERAPDAGVGGLVVMIVMVDFSIGVNHVRAKQA